MLTLGRSFTLPAAWPQQDRRATSQLMIPSWSFCHPVLDSDMEEATTRSRLIQQRLSGRNLWLPFRGLGRSGSGRLIDSATGKLYLSCRQRLTAPHQAGANYATKCLGLGGTGLMEFLSKPSRRHPRGVRRESGRKRRLGSHLNGSFENPRFVLLEIKSIRWTPCGACLSSLEPHVDDGGRLGSCVNVRQTEQRLGGNFNNSYEYV